MASGCTSAFASLQGRRRAAVRAWSYCYLRSDPEVVPEIRTSICNQLRRRRPRPGDKWHLDEVFLTINGARHYLWRAVDQDGHVLDISTKSPEQEGRKEVFPQATQGLKLVPRVIITDKLNSYGAAKREILPGVEHRQHRYLNNGPKLTPTDA